MAYDEALADRIRRVVGPRPDVLEKKMFGGVAFLLDGKMFVGVVKCCRARWLRDPGRAAIQLIAG